MNILHLEDNPQDAQLVRRLLDPLWPDLTITVVSDAADFIAEVERGSHDIILADYTLPSFSGLEALRRARELAPEIPFIFVTGTLGEQTAIEAVERGATDYVLKDQLNRLGIVVRRAVREAQERMEYRHSIERLRQSEARYRTIFTHSPLPMWIIDTTSQAFLDVNEAAIHHYGYSRDEFRAMSVAEIIVNSTAAWSRPEAPADTSDPFAGEAGLAQHRKKNGAIATVKEFVHEIDFAGGTARLTLINDVTANQLAAEKVKQLNAELEARVHERTSRLESAMKELEAFSYSVSHDLRAPLRGIDGFARALQEECGPSLGAEGARLLGTIRHETRRMGQLIEALLAFSRAGRQQIDRSTIDMTELARSAFQTLIETPPERKAVLQLKALPVAEGDRKLLRQVFANLLDNALKFTSGQPDPVIEVSGASEGGVHTYCVKDNGVGFDPRYGHKLFGVFQRLHSQDEFEGTGVGLALVQRIVQRHGGRVWAESTVGGGARFYFTLPDGAETPTPGK